MNELKTAKSSFRMEYEGQLEADGGLFVVFRLFFYVSDCLISSLNQVFLNAIIIGEKNKMKAKKGPKNILIAYLTGS